MQGLSDKERQTLTYIHRYINEYGRTPTNKEIARVLKISESLASVRVNKLTKIGAIARVELGGKSE